MIDRSTLTCLTLTTALCLCAGARAQSGTLAFTDDSITIGESGGAVDFTVERLSGSDGLVMVDISTQAGTAGSDVDYESNSATLVWESGDSSPKTFTIAMIQDSIAEGSETFQLVLSNPQFGATLGSPSTMTVTIQDDDTTHASCQMDDTTLCLRNERFQVSVDWRSEPNGFPDFASARVAEFQTNDSGLFYFKNASNLEFLLKVINGCPLNNNYWVFFAATTDVEFVVTVVDTEADIERQYTNSQGHSADAVTDTTAFATCP